MTDNAYEQDLSESSAGNQWLVVLAGLLVAAIAVAVLVMRHQVAADPYVQDVLVLNGHHDRGREIFQMNCAVCHGLEANGEVGPSLLGVSDRKSESRLIQQVVSGQTPPMPQFQPEPQDMADLLEYLEQL